MRFYTRQHKYYCGIDLQAGSMFICILDQEGKTVFHCNRKASPEAFLRAIEPYRQDIVVAVECMPALLNCQSRAAARPRSAHLTG